MLTQKMNSIIMIESQQVMRILIGHLNLSMCTHPFKLYEAYLNQICVVPPILVPITLSKSCLSINDPEDHLSENINHMYNVYATTNLHTYNIHARVLIYKEWLKNTTYLSMF